MAGYQPLANRYKEVAVKTANPLQLVVLLYDGAIHSLQEAKEHLKRNDIANRARCINRSISIISELQVCLNFQEGGDIAGSLDQLYDYMKRRMFKANVEQSAEPLEEVVTLLGNLRSAWGELAKQTQTSTAVSTDSQVLRTGITGATEVTGLNISG